MKKRDEIPSEAYSKEYLLGRHTEGYEEFIKGSLSLIKRKQIEMLDLREGLSVLEIGYGRGELLYHMARSGVKVTGIDHAPAAFEIAKETLREFRDDADIRIADCRDLPFPDNSFDRIMAGDVIEHLTIPSGYRMLQEAKRVLKPGGFFLLHTSPNSAFVKIIYPILVRPILNLINKEAISRFEDHLAVARKMHVYEYNMLSLRRILKKAGMNNATVWMDPDLLRSSNSEYSREFSGNFIVDLGGSLGKFTLFRFFFGNDLYAKYIKE